MELIFNRLYGEEKFSFAEFNKGELLFLVNYKILKESAFSWLLSHRLRIVMKFIQL